MRFENRWAKSWPNVVDSVRHVELIALKNGWRAEALDRRFREKAALEQHESDDSGMCRTCRQSSPCLTRLALTTTTPWHRSVEGQPYKLPLGVKDVQAAVAELLPDLVPENDTKSKHPPRQAS
ncbi:hypothetical protein [Streptomyces sp. Midd1]|uniref:hypothetical protein n=1 Tax=Streptomyces sp. Midd3 TaxID=3161191 RepID=UPI0034DAF80B